MKERNKALEKFLSGLDIFGKCFLSIKTQINHKKKPHIMWGVYLQIQIYFSSCLAIRTPMIDAIIRPLVQPLESPRQ